MTLIKQNWGNCAQNMAVSQGKFWSFFQCLNVPLYLSKDVWWMSAACCFKFPYMKIMDPAWKWLVWKSFESPSPSEIDALCYWDLLPLDNHEEHEKWFLPDLLISVCFLLPFAFLEWLAFAKFFIKCSQSRQSETHKRFQNSSPVIRTTDGHGSALDRKKNKLEILVLSSRRSKWDVLTASCQPSTKRELCSNENRSTTSSCAFSNFWQEWRGNTADGLTTQNLLVVQKDTKSSFSWLTTENKSTLPFEYYCNHDCSSCYDSSCRRQTSDSSAESGSICKMCCSKIKPCGKWRDIAYVRFRLLLYFWPAICGF